MGRQVLKGNDDGGGDFVNLLQSRNQIRADGAKYKL